ncbi:hypothetical protein RB653_004657 [Dictyostelium firmibasis]|uniref:Transmembrane protein n=1 Tax=Dictyostelium firmibasis TaxID=79012 RepID=A0AAN7U1D2_9MYCE
MEKILILIINLFIIIININKSSSLDITFIIDFNSRINYNASECGGSIDVDTFSLDYFFQNNSKQFPPCQSFEDVGDRIRQFSLKSFQNVSLFLNIKPYDWKNQVIVVSSAIGKIPSFCHFSISMIGKSYNDNSYYITIEGRSEFIGYNFTNDMICYNNYNSNDNDINYSSTNYNLSPPPPLSSSSQILLPRMIINNIKFIKWGYPIILIYQNNEISTKPSITIEFNNIITDSSNVFLVSAVGNRYQPINFVIRNSIFSNISNNNHTTLIWVLDNVWIDNCKFNNISISMPIVVKMDGILSISNSDFNYVSIINQDSLLYNQNQYIELNNINVNDSSFSSFLYQRYTPIVNSPIESQTIKNINKTNIIKNVKFIKNILTKPIPTPHGVISNYITGLFVIDGDVDSVPTNKSINNIHVEFSNVSIESFNQIDDNSKNLLETYNIHTLKILNNIKITQPNQLKVLIFTNDTIIDINNTFNNNNNNNNILTILEIFCKGNNNLINIEINDVGGESSDINNNLRKYCTNCNLNYIIVPNSKEKNDGGGNSDDFRKILIIPIVLGGMVFLSLLIGIIIFRKRVAKRFGKSDYYDSNNYINNNISYNNNNNINNNGVDMDRMDFGNIDNLNKLSDENIEVVGEIVSDH